MATEKIFKVVVSQPAKRRYQTIVLPYLFEHFSLDRALEIDKRIFKTAASLCKRPNRGSIEKYLIELREKFRFIIHKETKQFEIKIIYYIDENSLTVNITDFFPTKMDPVKLGKK